ncbi:DUF1798 family protein [Bacillus sp. FJAT-42376]|uniref:DUF1798 family protein n=1 Tax=Bacillus sp. FJAT-42376 TaxID=2014076 RepID=UPI000F4DB009|nr:DUF1798 family protein [Bacillus sp. FJAT-42376]AZB43296.1 DUF1798 family protein [Bacillus sp. FJAT-42376]
MNIELELSYKVKQINDESMKRYLQNKAEERPFDFYEDIKPVFEEGSRIAVKWKELIEERYKTDRPKHIHPSQLESAVSNIEQQILQSFDPKAKSVRYKNTKESIDYVVNSVIDWLIKKES